MIGLGIGRTMLFAALGLYAVVRFVLEDFRADDRGAALGLSTSQLISVGLVGLVLVIHQRQSARAEGGPATMRR